MQYYFQYNFGAPVDSTLVGDIFLDCCGSETAPQPTESRTTARSTVRNGDSLNI